MNAEERVAAAATRLGLDIEIVEFPQGTRTADDAAAAIGCAVAQIVKSLVFIVDDEPVVALVSGADRLDERRLAAAAGGDLVRRATPTEAQAATGYPVGGVPPLGHSRPLRCFMDDSLLTHPVVWSAAGTPTHVFSSPPAELADASGSQLAVIRRTCADGSPG